MRGPRYQRALEKGGPYQVGALINRLLTFYCTAASAPRVRGSGAPSRPFGVTKIELADV